MKSRAKMKLSLHDLSEACVTLTGNDCAGIVAGENDRLTINGGQLELQEGGVMYYGDDGSTCFFPGVTAAFYNQVHDLIAPNTAYQLNGYIGISPSWDSFDVTDFAHEYGHYLQQAEMGWAYYMEGVYSMYTMVTDSEGHMDDPFEAEATQLGADFLKANMKRTSED